MAMKRCPHCGVRKPASAFRSVPALRDGLNSWCKSCGVARTRQWRAENPDYELAHNAARRAPQLEKRCWCARTFLTARTNVRYCERHRSKKPSDVIRRSNALRRARIGPRGAAAVPLSDIYRRDGGRCWICHAEVDVTRHSPDPLSASLDHVVPLSRGGRHTASNIRLAHLGCNVRRGSRLPVVAG